MATAAPLAPESMIIIPGGGEAQIALSAGDRVRIIDPEGLQPGVLLLCADGGEQTISLFGADSPPGAEHRFTADAACAAIIKAPGAPMAPDAQDAPTELHVRIARADPASDLPPPLAEPLLDLRVSAATAQAYRVRAGDYIQIIDVAGKQCSDFIAFDAAALDAGQELEIDATVTRSLMGRSFSTPGLHARYFDARLRPLVEVVQDTVGRHDTFLLACTAKYYEDEGYPGHANCTENFNRALQPFGVAPRAGWPAINFFYNTILAADDTITLDEPWSRPGDYVLLRALTDLVCASSACPDDIDPANGWQPTDIHVRLYDRSAAPAAGNAHRMTPDAPARLTRETGFHARTSALTRQMTDYRGFWLPTAYANHGAIAEYWACRERAALIDLSPLRKFEVTGPDAEALMDLAVTRDMTKLAVGQIVYTAMCHETGGMIDDGTVFRLGPTNFRWVCGEDWCGVWLRRLAAERGLKAWVRSSTDQLSNVALQGPLSREILAPLVTSPAHRPTVAELGWFRFTTGKIGDLPVVVSRTGYSGELGYEIWCHPARAPDLWDALMAAGGPRGVLPAGLDALDMLRIEAGLVFAGYEFCDQTDPFEAGIGFAAPKSKRAAFIGSEALARRREHPQRVLAGLVIAGAEAVHHGDPVFAGRVQVGVVTSATRSPILGQTIALARLDVSQSAIGTALAIGKLDGHQKRIDAQVVRFPHYDPDKTRVRS
jgi:aminomethyltransferase